MTQVLLWETAVILGEHEITFKPSLVLKRGTPHSVACVQAEHEQSCDSGAHRQRHCKKYSHFIEVVSPTLDVL